MGIPPSCSQKRSPSHPRSPHGEVVSLRGLAVAAEVGETLAGGYLRYAVAALGAGLAALAVDLEPLPWLEVDLVAHEAAHDADGLDQHRAHRLVEVLDLLWLERGAGAIGIDAGREEDLVGVGVAYAGEEGLVREDVFDLAGMATQPLAELVEVDLQRFGAHAIPARDAAQLLGSDDVRHAHVEVVVVAQVAPVSKAQEPAGARAESVGHRDELEAPADHRIDGDEVAVGEVQQEELAATRHAA